MSNALELMIEPVLAAEGYDLVDIEVSPKGRTLRIFIDRLDRTAISVEDCSRASNTVQAVIDAAGIDYDRLEMSSPGIDRVLKRPAHFVRFVGEEVNLRLTTPVAKRSVFDAQLLAASDEAIEVEVDGEKISVALSQIKKARLKPKLDWKVVEKSDES